MEKHKLLLSSFTNTNEKSMNKTLNSFGNSQKFKKIPLLASIECQPSDYEFKFNKTNYKDRIGNIKTQSWEKAKQKSDFNEPKINNKQIIYSLKNYNLNATKTSNNTINFKFNSTSMNSYFHGKKLLLSKNPLLCRNKFVSNNKKKY